MSDACLCISQTVQGGQKIRTSNRTIMAQLRAVEMLARQRGVGWECSSAHRICSLCSHLARPFPPRACHSCAGSAINSSIIRMRITHCQSTIEWAVYVYVCSTGFQCWIVVGSHSQVRRSCAGRTKFSQMWACSRHWLRNIAVICLHIALRADLMTGT